MFSPLIDYCNSGTVSRCIRASDNVSMEIKMFWFSISCPYSLMLLADIDNILLPAFSQNGYNYHNHKYSRINLHTVYMYVVTFRCFFVT